MFLLPRAPFVWKEAVQLSFASVSCVFSLGEVSRQGRVHHILVVLLHNEGLLVSAGCTTALSGVGSIPEGTFIATGRERLICMTIAGFSWGV